MSYRDEVDALAARHAALEAEVAQKTKELDTAAQLLTEAQAKAKTSVLDNIRVATPCSAEWSAMVGDDRVRACRACQKNVYNISNMTRDEAEALIVGTSGNLCVRYFQRADGTILLADCTVGKSQKRKRRLVAAGAAALLAGGGGALAWKLTRTHDEPDRSEYIQGGVSMRIADPVPPHDEVIEVKGNMAEPPAEPLHEIKGRMVVPSKDGL